MTTHQHSLVEEDMVLKSSGKPEKKKIRFNHSLAEESLRSRSLLSGSHLALTADTALVCLRCLTVRKTRQPWPSLMAQWWNWPRSCSPRAVWG